MAGIAFQPVSNFAREDNNKPNKNCTNWFQGEFDGNGKTIKNFSTTGFSITGLNAGTNGSSSKFKTVYNEAIYGLFGTVYVPEGETVTIKNLTIEASIDMIIDDANQFVGDSVGALIGYAFGAGELIIDNVTINGVVNGYDGVAAFIGRAYGFSANNTNPQHGDYVAGTGLDDKKVHNLTVTFKNCVNNATVNSVRKCGAFIGSASNITKSFNNCFNNGNITCMGKEEDIKLGCVSATGTNGSGYYQAGIIMDNGTVARTEVEGVTNKGTIKVG